MPNAILCSVRVCPWEPDLSFPLCKMEIVAGSAHLKGITARVMGEVGMKGGSQIRGVVMACLGDPGALGG